MNSFFTPEREQRTYKKAHILLKIEHHSSDLSSVTTRSNTPEELEKCSSEAENGSYKKTFKTYHNHDSEHSIHSYDETVDGQNFEIDVCPKRKKFVNIEERRQYVEEYKKKYKTEICKNWELRGTCKFGDRCCFAHGKHELKNKSVTHMKFKTKPCKQYFQVGYCPYGQRCQYLHKEALSPNIFFNGDFASEVNYFDLYEDLHEVNRLCGTDVQLYQVLNKLPTRNRLSAFERANNDSW